LLLACILGGCASLIIGWVETPLNLTLGDAVAGSLGDWVRLTPMTWVIWTERTTAEVGQAFKDKLKSGDIVIAMYLDAREAAGVAPQWLWNWINAKIFLQKWSG
jgi:hypothetical protein